MESSRKKRKIDSTDTPSTKFKTVYLAGPINPKSWKTNEWRKCMEQILNHLTNNSINILDPTAPACVPVSAPTPGQYFASPEKWYQNSKQHIVARCLKMVDDSDIVIAFLPQQEYTVGSVHEVVYALEKKKTVFIIQPVKNQKNTLSTWYVGLVKPGFIFDGLGFHEKQKDNNIGEILKINKFDKTTPEVKEVRGFLNWLITHYKEHFM